MYDNVSSVMCEQPFAMRQFPTKADESVLCVGSLLEFPSASWAVNQG